MARCTGNPTSTLGGGGGTKLFCSQALNATEANVTKAIREAMAVRSRTISFSLEYADARACLIYVPRLFCFGKRLLFENAFATHE
jgi:hypothetical protein